MATSINSQLSSFIFATGKKRSNKEVAMFRTKIMTTLSKERPMKDIIKNKMLMKKINEILSIFKTGQITILGWEAMVMQYLWFDTETFNDILNENQIYHGSLHELFEAVKEHRDKQITSDFVNWLNDNLDKPEVKANYSRYTLQLAMDLTA